MNQSVERQTIGAALRVALTAVLLLTPLSAQEAVEEKSERNSDLEIASVRITEPRLPTPSSLATDEGLDYRIGKQDLLEIRVFELEELSQTVRVGGDGHISLPLLGKVRVAGLTATEIEEQLEGLLDPRYIVDPHVSVFVKEYVSTKVAISGAVKTPGRFEMIGPMTLLDMVSQAGGLRDDHGDEIVIFRMMTDGTKRRLSVDLQRLVYVAEPDQNVDLEPGDVIYVTTQERIRIFVGGEVNNPNMFEIPKSEPVTMMKAITLAGGTTARAAEKKIQIIRTDASGNRISFMVNYRKVRRGEVDDPILRPDDVVFVETSFF